MSRLAVTLALVVVSSTAHAQTVKAQPGQVTVDGRAVPTLTTGGVTYIRLDALVGQGGLTREGTGLFLRTFPNATPIRTQGCVGEWLSNGAVRLQVSGVNFNDTAMRPAWTVSLNGQKVLKTLGDDYRTTLATQLTFQDGTTVRTGDDDTNANLDFYPRSVSTSLKVSAFRKGIESPTNRPTRLILPAVTVSGKAYAAVTVDLTCQR